MPRIAICIFLAVFFVPAVAQFELNVKAAFHTTISASSVSHFAPTDHLVYRFSQLTSSVTALASIVHLQYQGRNESSLATHPGAMIFAVSSYAVHYYSACSVVPRLLPRRFAFLAHPLVVSSGNIGAASLLSVVLQEKAAPSVVYAIFGLLTAAELLLIWLHRNRVAQENEADHWVRRLFPNLGNTFSIDLEADVA